MKQAVLNFLNWLMVKVGAPVSGGWSWLLSWILKPLASLIAGYLQKWLTHLTNAVKEYFAMKRDQKRVDKREETLKDGANEQDQVDATTDLLNGK